MKFDDPVSLADMKKHAKNVAKACENDVSKAKPYWSNSKN